LERHQQTPPANAPLNLTAHSSDCHANSTVQL
jgi:hypothetical protein